MAGWSVIKAPEQTGMGRLPGPVPGPSCLPLQSYPCLGHFHALKSRTYSCTTKLTQDLSDSLPALSSRATVRSEHTPQAFIWTADPT